jgi:hypothetical protein
LYIISTIEKDMSIQQQTQQQTFLTAWQPETDGDGDRPALEFTKLNLRNEEWSDIVAKEGMEATCWRDLECQLGVEAQVKKTQNATGDKKGGVVPKEVSAYKFGGIIHPSLSTAYFEEFQEYLQGQHKRCFTKADVADIINQHLFDTMAQPMARAWGQRMSGGVHKPMGDDYWADTFMGGFDMSTEKVNATLDHIGDVREKRVGGPRGPRGPSAKEIEQDALIQHQAQEMAKMRAEMDELKKTKIAPKKMRVAKKIKETTKKELSDEEVVDSEDEE